MASTINASTSPAAIIQTADGTGILNLQAAGVTQATISSSGFSVGGAVLSPYTMKNRIINGAMVIDQRNAGASVTSGFPVDRFQVYSTQSSKWTAQQSTTAPTGFTNSVIITSSSSYSPISSDYFSYTTRIEGFNVADLDWGTANAKTVTVSFWVRSSLTGTWTGALHNNAFNRVYPFSYTISSANTWEYKTVTIAGDTTGTWLTNNSVGIEIGFAFSVGSSGLGTAGAWTNTASIFGATGQTNLLGTNGATFYITGVQLEVGSSATSFEFKLYNQELANCQRYYQKTFNIETAPAAATGQIGSINVICGAGTGSAQGYMGQWNFPVVMRTTPTVTTYNTNTAASSAWYDSGGGSVAAAATGTGTRSTSIYNTGTPVSPRNAVIHATAEAEL